MGLDLEYIDGQTPLEEEKDSLLIPAIATRRELDEFEQQNTEQAIQWTLGRAFKRRWFLRRTLSVRCIQGGMPMFGHRQAGSEKPTKAFKGDYSLLPASAGSSGIGIAIQIRE